MKKHLERYRNIYLMLLFIAIPKGFIFSQQGALIRYFHRGVEMNYKQISDSVFVSQVETSNIDYNMFLRDLRESGDMEKYNKCVPDSACWLTKTEYSFSKRYYTYYNSDPTYNFYPLVNISLEAMNLYCSWLTQIYEDKGRKYQKVKVRLPTEDEWERFANPNSYLNLPWDSHTAYRPCEKKGCQDSCLTANIKVKDMDTGTDLIGVFGTGAVESTTMIPMKGSSYYDIIGNVSEMTSDGKPKGGSWDNYLSECYINRSQDFNAPDPRLGFRIIIEILEF